MVDPASAEAGPVICPFRLLTGLPCPGCGLTRSWIYLVHGQWTDGLVVNPFGIVALMATVALITSVLAAVVRGRELPSLDAVMSSPAVRGGALVWVAFGVARAGRWQPGTTRCEPQGRFSRRLDTGLKRHDLSNAEKWLKNARPYSYHV